MPSYNVGKLEDCFTNKLRSTASTGTDHKKFDFFDDAGNRVATTWLSRSWRHTTSISPAMVSTIQRQLYLQGKPREFAQLVSCPLTREAYLDLIGATVNRA